VAWGYLDSMYTEPCSHRVLRINFHKSDSGRADTEVLCSVPCTPCNPTHKLCSVEGDEHMVSATALKMLMQALPRETRPDSSYSSRVIEGCGERDRVVLFHSGLISIYRYVVLIWYSIVQLSLTLGAVGPDVSIALPQEVCSCL
jgi:hypothetical protein